MAKKKLARQKVILGIDPGLATTGWAILTLKNRKITKCHWGTIDTRAKVPIGERLDKIYHQINHLIEKYQPNVLAIENIYFGKNVKTAIVVGQAKGVITLAGYNHKLKFEEFTPLQIKTATCGYGRANKQQVQRMIRKLLNLKSTPKPDDAADALAVAYTSSVSNNTI